MYYQLTNFEKEIRAQEAAGNAGKSWAYTMKSCPADSVANMAALDRVYEAAGIGARPSVRLSTVHNCFASVFGVTSIDFTHRRTRLLQSRRCEMRGALSS